MDTNILRLAIGMTEDKVNFRCTKYPELKDCDSCKEHKSCEAKHITWNCDGDLHFFKESLASLGVKDDTEYINYVSSHGGYCDCEIIFNIKDSKEFNDMFKVV